MTIFGMLRIRNEARWIAGVLASIFPICERVFVLDDHSEDGTAELCETSGGPVTVFRSQFTGLDESRDKNFLLEQVMSCVPPRYPGGDCLAGDERSPFWALAIDGDELLDARGADTIRRVLPTTPGHAFKLPVRYLWNSDMSLYPERRQVRVDGVYRNFARPSLFRLSNRRFRFQSTPWGGNLHCSSIPQQLLHVAQVTLDAPLWHLGYNDRADRLRKYAWYNRVDPGNQGEDQYRHVVQGDIPEVPAGVILRHAGPLELVTEDLKCSGA